MPGLDIKALGALGARIGFSLAGNAKVQVTLNLGAATAGVYNPVTDMVEAGTPATQVPLEVLAYQTKEQQNILADQEGQANQVEIKTLLVNVAELRAGMTAAGVAILPPAGQEITETDTVTEAGTTWGILSVAPDPSAATITLQVRK